MLAFPCQNARLAPNSHGHKHTQLLALHDFLPSDTHTYPIYSVIMVIFSLVMVLH